MDYYGLLPGFKVNRKLTRDEETYNLKQIDKIELDVMQLTPDGKVISMSSNYLELVDKFYSSKGVVAFVGVLSLPAFLFLSLSILHTVIFEYGWSGVGVSYPYLLLLIPLLGTNVLTYIMFKSEFFAWTHYPIRFDRNNKMVHFFRTDGTICSVPWDKIFFTSGLSHRKDFNKDYYISGHILADDNETVIDTFCLPATSSDRKELERHWEFVRRYMEEGPESVVHAVKECLPIAGKREGYQFGLIILISAHSGAPIILFPLIFTLSFIFSIPRYIAMVTSKIPVWPKSIEEQCTALENDPYAVDASINSKHPWRDMFRKQTEDEC